MSTATTRIGPRRVMLGGRGRSRSLRRRADDVWREVLRRHPDVAADDTRLAVSRVELTSTGMLVMRLGSAGRSMRAVLKLPVRPGADRALARETAALDALAADDRIAGWRRVVPRVLGRGTLEGQAYRLDSALPGLRVPAGGRRRALPAAGAAIATLHERTAHDPPPGFSAAAAWVDAPWRELELRTSRRGPIAAAGPRLREELHAALDGRRIRCAVIHGDFWLGNLMFAPDGSVGGIVDWESAGFDALPMHDVLHLLLYARRSASGAELGELVARQLRDGHWSDDERAILSRHHTWAGDELSERHALLLYWLRHAAVHARQQPIRSGYRYRFWEHRNLLPVLEAL